MTDAPKYQVIDGAELEALQQDCQDVTSFIAGKYGVDLTFDDESILWLASFIEANRGEMDRETQRLYAVKIGIFLGCAIIHRHGGVWVRTDDDDLAVRFASGLLAFPITKAAKQLRHGSIDNVYGLYRNVGTLLGQRQSDQ